MNATGAKTDCHCAKPACSDPVSATAADTSAQAVSSDVLRRQINAAVTSNALSMVEAMISHAKEGKYQALKYLFEMVGLYPALADEENPQEESLAKILLNGLGIAEEADPPKGAEVTAMGETPDAVE